MIINRYMTINNEVTHNHSEECVACTPQYIITCNARILAFSPRAFNKATSIYTS